MSDKEKYVISEKVVQDLCKKLKFDEKKLLELMVKTGLRLSDLELTVLECNRCKHKWHPKTNKKPKVCPECKSPYWDKPRIKKVKA